MFDRMLPEEELIARRDALWRECDPHAEFARELEKEPIETQIVALALVVGMRRARPTRH